MATHVPAKKKAIRAKQSSPDAELDAFERRAKAASAAALSARDKFIARLESVDPSLVREFFTFLCAMVDPISALQEELSADVRSLRNDSGVPAKRRSKRNG